MSDKWFSEFTYQVVVDKKYLTEEQREELDQAPIALEPWDPHGVSGLRRTPAPRRRGRGEKERQE